MQSNKMEDRGDGAMKTHLTGCEMLVMKQTRRGCLQEFLGCEALTEFKFFIGETQVFEALEETDCFCRMCCTAIHPYKMTVKEVQTNEEIVTLDRPLRCAAGGCKCCCYQEAFVTSKGANLGSIKENCWYCVPSMKVFDPAGAELYMISPPTCVGGICINCCAEGNPCGKGCCKQSFRVYAPESRKTGADDPYLGSILKKPKSAMVEIFTDAVTMDVSFPKDATPEQKGLLTGVGLFLNSVFFEGNDD